MNMLLPGAGWLLRFSEDKVEEEIFEEFAQLGNEERDSSRGHGLGLAIVKGLTRVLGHQVWVRSQPGRGTVFGVSLPGAEQAASAPAEAAAPPLPRSA